jgi:hypothetical protein
MAYRLKLKGLLAPEVRRIALEQIEMARAALLRPHDRAAGVHDARRSLKRLRAMLRLVRPALDEAWFKQSNRQLALLGQRLSLSRDRDVMVVTLAKLENGAGGLPKAVADRLRHALTHPQKTAGARANPNRSVATALRQAETLFSNARLRNVDIDRMADGLKQSYRKARAAFREAYDRPTDETFHTWRKRTQAHWRHMQLLGRGWPESIGARAAEAKELSRLLGDDHDLAVLLRFAQDHAAGALSPDDLAALTAACVAGQRQLRERARPHGERLFAERPSQLSKRIMRYWNAAGQLSVLLPAEPPGEAPAASGQSPVRRAKGAAASRARRPRRKRASR